MHANALPDLSSRELEAVLAVAHYRSFLAAASALRLSQSATTRMIQRVERELGAILFVRTTRQVSITETGREFVALAQRLLNDLKINVAHLRSRNTQPKGQVVVSSVFSLADAMLPSLMADFGKQFPGIELHLREGLQSSVREDVQSGLSDFGVAYIEDAVEPFAAETLCMTGFRVLAPADHILASRKSVSLHFLATLPLVSFPAESLTRQIIDHAAAEAGFRLKYPMTANRLATLHSLVRNRIGLAVVPEKEISTTNDRSLISRPLNGRGLARRMGLIRSRERQLSPAAALFINVVRKWVTKSSRSSGSKGLPSRRTRSL